MSDAPTHTDHLARGALARELASLQREDYILLVLRDDLYEGSWALMRQDLVDRREGRPCVFKLSQRIARDVERIDRLRAVERAYGIDLADHVDLEIELTRLGRARSTQDEEYAPWDG